MHYVSATAKKVDRYLTDSSKSLKGKYLAPGQLEKGRSLPY